MGAPQWVELGAHRFHPDTGELARDGRSVTLPRQPARLLVFLIDHAGEVVSREACIAHLWGETTTVVYDDGLNFCVRQIRSALGESARAGGHLETLPRRGYRLNGPVRRIPHLSEPAKSPVHGKSPVLVAAWVASVLLALGVGTFLPLVVQGVEAHLTGGACPWRVLFHG